MLLYYSNVMLNLRKKKNARIMYTNYIQSVGI